MGLSGNQFLLYMKAGQAGQGAEGGGMMQTFLFFGVIIVIFWFFMIRPQKQKQKQREAMLKALDKGDKVVSIGGIRGQVAKVGEETVTVKVDDGCKIEFSRSAIAEVIRSTSSSDEKTNAEPQKKKGDGQKEGLASSESQGKDEESNQSAESLDTEDKGV